MLRVYCSWPGVSAMMNFLLRGGEIAVGNVDGDALLAFGAEAIGEQREIDLAGRRGSLALDGANLVVVDRLRIVEEAADERGFAVVHAAGGGEAQQVLVVRFLAQKIVDGEWRETGGRVDMIIEVALPLLDFHGAVLVVVDDAVGALRGAEGDELGDDVGHGVASERMAPVHGLQPRERRRSGPLRLLAGMG